MQVTGSIKSIIHGVSTQSPRERIEGQCWEMTNFLPDPKDGVVRRPGCKYVGAGSFPDTGAAWGWREISLGGVDYKVGCSAGQIKVIRQSDGVLLGTNQAASAAAYFAEGITAATSIGDYGVLASPVSPQVSNIAGEPTSAPAGKYFCLVEVKQGVYNGIYKVVRKSTGAAVATFTAPDGSAAAHGAQGQPAYIADQLKTQLTSSGLFSSVVSNNAIIGIEAADAALIADLAVEDGAYNSRMRLVYDFWADTASLPTVAPDSLVVRIGNIDLSEGDFYMKFKQHGTLAAGAYLTPRAGQWIECRAPGQHSGGSLVSTTMPRLLYVYNGTAFVGTGPEIKAAVAAAGGPALEEVDWGSRTVGDVDTNDDPLFVGHSIKWLGTFQDRLVIVSDAAVTMSRISDYLELYRSTIVSILDDDRVNMSSTFNEKDELCGAALYDRNLIVIGTKTHYVVPGKSPVTPSSALAKTASYDSAPAVHPVTMGDDVYFCSVSENNADLLSITTRDIIDSTTVSSVGSHVQGYVPGDIVSLVAAPKLNIVFMLSASGVLYGYRTLTVERKRVLSSWFKFTFGHKAGAKLASVSVENTVVNLLFTRVEGGTLRYVVAALDLDRKGYTAEDNQHYLDFWQKQNIAAGTTALSAFGPAALLDDSFRVIDPATGNTHGTVTTSNVTASKSISNAITGQLFDYKFIPTLPIARDRDGKPVAIGKLTVGQMQLTYSYGSRFDVTVQDKYRTRELEHRASRVGTETLVIGKAYVGAGAVLFPVASAEPDALVTISGKDHFPLVFTYLDWKGQYFKHGRSM